MILALLSFVVLIVLISANVWVSSLVYHRYLTHRAMDLNKWVGRALTLYLQGMAFAPPLSWVASHAAHHAGADTPEDPYSPEVHGFLRVVFLTPLLVTRWRMRNGEMIIAKYTRRVPDRQFYEFCDRTWWCSLMMAAFAGAFFLLLGWAGLLVYAIESYGFYVLMGWFNATGHTQGDRPSQNSGTNRHGARWLFMNLCMAGELLHNHHHHAPHSANFGLAGETDVGYLVCRALAFARLAERFEEAETLVGYRTAMTHLLALLGFAWYFEVGALDLIQYILVKPSDGIRHSEYAGRSDARLLSSQSYARPNLPPIGKKTA